MASAASLSSAEKAWIEQGVGFGVRGDGRSHLLVRPSFVETGILVGTVGSARVVRAGTDVVVGVKPELCDARSGLGWSLFWPLTPESAAWGAC